MKLDSIYYYTSNANVAVSQTVNGQKIMVNSSISSRITFKVTGIRDTLYDMEMNYGYLGFKMQLPGNSVDYNSDKNDPNDISSGIFNAFKNQPLKAVMTKSGNLVSVKGFDAIFARITGKFTTAPADLVAQVKNMMEQSFGERAFRSNFEMGMPIYPSIPVRKGVLWTSDTQLVSNSPAYVHTVYGLLDITDNYYHIHATSTITYPDKDKFIDNAGRLMRYNLNGIMNTDIAVDKMTGWVKQSTISQNITGSTDIKTPAKIPGEIEVPIVIPIEMQSDITITDIH